MTTEYWFPTPIFYSGFLGDEYKIVSEEIDTVVKDILKNDKHQYLSDASKIGDKPLNETYNVREQLFNTYDLPNFHNGVSKFIKQFTDDIQLFDDYNKFIYTESWINIFNEDRYHPSHNHRSCDISGVYYHTVPPGSGDIVFETPIPHVETGQFPYGRVSSGTIKHTVESGKLLLFPFWLKHSVQKASQNFNNQQRISIAFNIKLSRDN